MCEINPKHAKIFRLEFFTSHSMLDKEFERITAETAIEMEILANSNSKLRCHIHEAYDDKLLIREGLKRMAYHLAVNKDGKLFVGTMQKLLGDVYKEIDDGYWD
jgi:hypothetical protein